MTIVGPGNKNAPMGRRNRWYNCSMKLVALDVEDDQLRQAADAVDAALGVERAKQAARLGSRASALKLLRGQNILKGTVEAKRGSVVSRRIIATHAAPRAREDDEDGTASRVRPKGRSGRSNWPRNKAERALMEARKDELARQRENELVDLARRENVEAAVGGLAGADGAEPYFPSADQLRGVDAITNRLAQTLEVPAEQLGPPTATVTCVRDRGLRLLAYETASPRDLGASVAVENGTAAVSFSLDTPPEASPPLAAGMAQVYPLSQPHRVPHGDWKVTLFYRARL